MSDSNASGAQNGGTITIDDPLRITFKTRQTMLDTRGTLEVTIYNLARSGSSAVTQLRNLYNRVVLQAGYQTGQFGTIFDGSIIDFEQGREPSLVETYLKIWAQDGDGAYNLATAQISVAAGTPANEAVMQLIAPMLKAGAILGQVVGLSTSPLIRGIVHSGMAVDGLKKFGLNSYIQNGILHIAPVGYSFSVGSPVTLSSNTGLIGMASLTGNNGIKGDCLLNPGLLIHGIVVIDQADVNQASGQGGTGTNGVTTSKGPQIGQFGFYVDPSADGQYELLVIEHEGDSRGNEWKTHFRGWGVGTPLTPTGQQFFQGYNQGPTAGQQQTFTATPNIPPDPAVTPPNGGSP